jgi:hypothetical protein
MKVKLVPLWAEFEEEKEARPGQGKKGNSSRVTGTTPENHPTPLFVLRCGHRQSAGISSASAPISYQKEKGQQLSPF